MATRATNSKLSPGQDSIDRVRARKTDAGHYVMDWHAVLADGTHLRKRSQGQTVGECRRRARATLDKIKSTSQSDARWHAGSRIDRFITEVCITEAEESGNQEVTVKSTKRHLRRIAEAWKGRTISAVASTPQPSIDLLRKLAKEHGHGSATRARPVLSAYVFDPLFRQGLIHSNPIRGMEIKIPGAGKRRRGGVNLDKDEYAASLVYLLGIDTDDVHPAQPSPVRTPQAQRKRRAQVDLCLIQAATGTRISEARQLRWDRHIHDDGDGITVTVTEDISKTGRERTVPVLDARVVERIRARRDLGTTYVIGHPTGEPDEAWPSSSAGAASAEMYKELYKELGYDVFETNRSHLWRATLNTLLAPTVPLAVRVAMFGHTEDVNERSYTGKVDTSVAVTAAQALSL